MVVAPKRHCFNLAKLDLQSVAVHTVPTTLITTRAARRGIASRCTSLHAGHHIESNRSSLDATIVPVMHLSAIIHVIGPVCARNSVDAARTVAHLIAQVSVKQSITLDICHICHHI